MSKAVIISGVPPYLLKTAGNPEGVDASVFDGIQKAVAADRHAFFTSFFQNFYNTDVFLGKRVSEQVVQASWNIAAGASATASLACVPTWHEDFREDLAHIDVPTLVIQGDADRILPIAATGLRTAKLIKGARQLIVKDGWPALYHVDARGRSKRGLAELPWRECRQVAVSGRLSEVEMRNAQVYKRRTHMKPGNLVSICLLATAAAGNAVWVQVQAARRPRLFVCAPNTDIW